MGCVVEEGQAGARGIAEIENVQRRGTLVEAVAVGARVEAEERTDQQSDSRLVGGDRDMLARMLRDDLEKRGQGAGGDGEATLAPLRREGERVSLPALIFFRIKLLDLRASPLFP